MKNLRIMGAALASLGILLSAPAGAASMSFTPESSSGLVQTVSGCHRDVERHYVPEFGRRAWHFHRGPNCRPVEVNGPAPIAPLPPRDCHRDVQRHYLPEFGRRVTHRHVGPNCRVQVFNQIEPGRPHGGTCVQIGPVTFCENR